MYRVFYNNTLIADSRIEDLAIINPVVSLKVNCAGTFTFTMPSNHPYYDLIQKKVGLIKVFRDEEQIFEGDCVRTTVDFFKQKKFECEGDLAFLNDTFLRPGRVEDLTSRQLLERYIASHNSLVSEEKRFTVGQVTAHDSNDSISCYTNYNSTMTEIKEDLIDDIGGFLRVRHENNIRYLDYLASSPRTNSQIIRLGENLLDLSVGLDTEELATVIIPLGETLDTQSIPGLDERLTIKTAAADSMHPVGTDYVYSQAAVSSFGWIEKVVEWNDVTEVSNLLSKGKKYLQETQFENLVIKAKAIDLGITSEELQKFRLLDMIRIISEPHGLDRYFMLSELNINLNNPEQDTVTLGIEEFNSLTAKSASANEKILKDIEQLPTSNQVKSAIDNATALITGAEGGYVVIERNADGKPAELRIQDALNNPTKIWRWNVNGLGYSNDGGQTYGLAMTMDGAIVADYVTSGIMSADRIRGGELIVGGSGTAASGTIYIKDSSNKNIITISNSGLTLYDASGNVKASLNHSGLTINNGVINSTTINGVTIKASCKIQTDAFIVNEGGQIYCHGGVVSDDSMSSSGSVSASKGINCYGTNGEGFYCTNNASVGSLTVRGTTQNTYIEGSGMVDKNWFVRGYVGPPSDKRLKKNIKSIAKEYASNILDKLNPVFFKFKDDEKGRLRVGLIAQEVQQSCDDSTPYVCESDTDIEGMPENFLAVDYNSFIPLLIKGYQELKEEIKELKGE